MKTYKTNEILEILQITKNTFAKLVADKDSALSKVTFRIGTGYRISEENMVALVNGEIKS